MHNSARMLRWSTRSRVFELQPGVWPIMGILNVTPDSFSDGGRFASAHDAVQAGLEMVLQGAELIDIGGESTRPGAANVSIDEQITRTQPVIQKLRGLLDARGDTNVVISIDTTRSVVAAAAIAAGAGVINDVSGGKDDAEILPLAAATRCGLILMHRLHKPVADSFSDSYVTTPKYPRGVVAEVIHEFEHNLLPSALAAGVQHDQIMIDPGLGFGKGVEDNLCLLTATSRLRESLQRPVLSALSRKSFIGRVTFERDSKPDERDSATLIFSIQHLRSGADMLRVHQVETHAQIVRATRALDTASLAHTPINRL